MEISTKSTIAAQCRRLHSADSPLSATAAPRRTPTIAQSSFNQTWKRNQTELAWDISKKAGARIGYRYGDRDFNHFNDYLPGDVDHFVGLEKTALLGFWARPTHALRLNFDLEHTNYNGVFVRLSPRKETRYRFQTTYTPRSWATLGGSINILQESNADLQTQYLAHNQNYGLTASLAPRERFGLDLAYNFNSVIQNALICFNDTPPAGVILPFVTNAEANDCAGNDTSNNLLANSYYTNHTNFGMATVRFKPAKRVIGQCRLQHHQRRWHRSAVQHPAASRHIAVQVPSAGGEPERGYWPQVGL